MNPSAPDRTPPGTLSVIIITRNEAHNLADCLASVAFADERIVLDQGSTDGTAELARSLGASVHTVPDWPGFGPQKNRALALAGGRWVLSLDADERLSPELARSVRQLVERDAAGLEPAAHRAYRLARLSSFCGQWMRHGDWYPDHVLRLFERGAGRFTDDLVHERLDVSGTSGLLEGNLLHFTMSDLDDALGKLNRYTTGRAQDMQRLGRRGGLGAALGHAAWAFVRAYGLKRGFLDGRLGFVLALYVAESTYYRYLKLGLLASVPSKPAAGAGIAP